MRACPIALADDLLSTERPKITAIQQFLSILAHFYLLTVEIAMISRDNHVLFIFGAIFYLAISMTAHLMW